MSGSTEAVIVIPIVAFLLLFGWILMVFWADSHPRWGNSEVPGQPSSRAASLQDEGRIPSPRVESPGAPDRPAPGSEHVNR
jgi:hypothetical protein